MTEIRLIPTPFHHNLLNILPCLIQPYPILTINPTQADRTLPHSPTPSNLDLSPHLVTLSQTHPCATQTDTSADILSFMGLTRPDPSRQGWESNRLVQESGPLWLSGESRPRSRPDPRIVASWASQSNPTLPDQVGSQFGLAGTQPNLSPIGLGLFNLERSGWV